MSDSTGDVPHSHPTDADIDVDIGITPQQLMSTLRDLTSFVKEQQTTNARLLSLLSQQPKPPPSQPTSTVVDDASNDDEMLPMDEEQKRQVVRDARKSVILANTNNNTVYNGDLLSPSTPAPRRQSEAERERRQTRFVHDTTPIHTPATRSPLVPPLLKARLPAVKKSKESPYYEANQTMSKLDKFYGDRKNDKDVDVYGFVRSMDFQLNRWMEHETFGKLELVTSCTGGAAQMWLLKKRDDLSVLYAQNAITAEMTEWEYVRTEFIEQMGGGQTERLAQAKLLTLKLGRGGSEDLAKFIARFDEYAQRAYPLSKYPDTHARSLMLAQLFDARVKDSDLYVWSQMMRTQPRPEMLKEMQDALSAAWEVEQVIKDARASSKRSYSDSAQGRGGNAPMSHSLNSIEDGDEGSPGGHEGAEAANVMAAKNGGGQKRVFNKHINSQIAYQIIRANRCLLCYSKEHRASGCTSPAKQAPTAAELKAWAGQP